MTHKDCGGKLQVLDSVQTQKPKGINIKRIRICKKCGATIISNEIINNAEVSKTYKHRSYYG